MWAHEEQNEPGQVTKKGSHRSYTIHDGLRHAISGMEVRRIGNSGSKSNGIEFLRTTGINEKRPLISNFIIADEAYLNTYNWRNEC